VRRSGAVAGASVALLSSIFPSGAPAFEAEALAEATAAGSARTQAAFADGLAAGRAVGGAVAASAKTDRFDAVWTGTVPTGPGFWFSSATPPAPPLLPLLGQMRPFFMHSGGQFRPFLPERDDGLATVAWLRDQPWCDGQVSMVGGSYLGHTQWAVAPYVDPPLRSVSLNITMANFSAAFYQHGAPSLLNTLAWTGLVGRQERGLAGVIPGPLQLARMKRALRKVPLQAADVDEARTQREQPPAPA